MEDIVMKYKIIKFKKNKFHKLITIEVSPNWFQKIFGKKSWLESYKGYNQIWYKLPNRVHSKTKDNLLNLLESENNLIQN
jgi:hypothetical protein